MVVLQLLTKRQSGKFDLKAMRDYDNPASNVFSVLPGIQHCLGIAESTYGGGNLIVECNWQVESRPYRTTYSTHAIKNDCGASQNSKAPQSYIRDRHTGTTHAGIRSHVITGAACRRASSASSAAGRRQPPVSSSGASGRTASSAGLRRQASYRCHALCVRAVTHL